MRREDAISNCALCAWTENEQGAVSERRFIMSWHAAEHLAPEPLPLNACSCATAHEGPTPQDSNSSASTDESAADASKSTTSSSESEEDASDSTLEPDLEDPWAPCDPFDDASCDEGEKCVPGATQTSAPNWDL